MSTEEFIKNFRDGDTRQLALQGGRYPEVNMPFALDQIAGWQTARTKLPTWAACEGIVYPPHLSMEQCSSEVTANSKFKSFLMSEECFSKGGSPLWGSGEEGRAVDLTGGFGVDFSFMARSFAEATYVERQEHLCEIARHNFELLGLTQARVVCGDGVEYLHSMKPVDFIYLDPARRDSHGGRTYALEDCTPNILELKDELLEKAPVVMVKLSPMLDWHKVVSDLGCVSELKIISVKNECKEMVVVLRRENTEPLRIEAINDDETVTFSASEAEMAKTRILSDDSITANLESLQSSSLPFGGGLGKGASSGGPLFLYEPNSSIMKAGCFGLLCERYGVKKIAKDSNLFISDKTVDFPGRKFQISAVSTMNKKELKRALMGINQANVAVRNFPLTAEALRKQLKLKDGGEVYIFGTTIEDKKHILFITRKV